MNRQYNYRPEPTIEGYWSVAAFYLDDDTRVPWSGMNTSWVESEREECLEYANSLNRANNRPLAK